MLTLQNERQKYESRDNAEKFALHLGQRKLFYTLLLFIKKIEKDAKILYIGSASGRNIYYAHLLFPEIEWHLYDPSKFSSLLENNPKIKIYNKYFEESDCEKFAGCYFISDIRSGQNSQEDVKFDMELQKQLCLKIKPKLCMLKFKLPWDEGKSNYFGGEIYLQPRIGPTSSETRLITSDFQIIEYDNDEYNDRIFYFQKNIRNSKFECQFGIGCKCWDCWAECQIYGENKKAIEYANILGNINIPPHNLYLEIEDYKKRIELCKEEILKYNEFKQKNKVNKFNIITPRDVRNKILKNSKQNECVEVPFDIFKKLFGRTRFIKNKKFKQFMVLETDFNIDFVKSLIEIMKGEYYNCLANIFQSDFCEFAKKYLPKSLLAKINQIRREYGLF